MNMDSFNRMMHAVLFLSVIMLCGCEDLVVRDTSSLLVPKFETLVFEIRIADFD